MKRYELNALIEYLENVQKNVSKTLEELKTMVPELQPRKIIIEPKLFCKRCVSTNRNYEYEYQRTKTFDDKIMKNYKCRGCGHTLVTETPKEKED